MIILRNHLCAVARLVVRVVFIVRVYHPHIKSHFPCVVSGNEHLRLLLRLRQRRPAEYRSVAALGELHKFSDELLLLRSRRYVVQYLVLLRSVHSHILRRAVVCDLVVEHRQLRHFDEVAETLLLHYIVCHIELEVGGLLGENRRPCVEAADVLPLQFLGTEILEQQIQFSQGVADGRA